MGHNWKNDIINYEIDLMREPILNIILFTIYIYSIIYIINTCYLRNILNGKAFIISSIYSQNNKIMINQNKLINIKSADNLTFNRKDLISSLWIFINEYCKIIKLGISETKRQLLKLVIIEYIYNILKNNKLNIKLLNKTINKLSNINYKNNRSFINMKPKSNMVDIIDTNFFEWLAGIIDGDGNFDLRILNGKLRLKAIRIKLHNRDLRILTRIQNKLNMGRINGVNNKPYSIWIISTNKEMTYLINNINGLIRIKYESFKKSCYDLNIIPIESNYIIPTLSPYFSGLIDTDGSIVFNYSKNRIECNIEFKYNEFTKKIDFSKVIPNCKPYIIRRTKTLKNYNKIYYSIAFKYQNVKDMIFVYDYFMKNRLYSDFKFYRVSLIKDFILIRKYYKYPKDSKEYMIYKSFILKFIKYENPNWHKIPFITKL